MSRTPLARVSALALIAAIGTAPLAHAQSNSNVFMDEVITTATKSADPENVQDVPVAVTALSSDTLEALKVRDLEQLAFAAPKEEPLQLEVLGPSHRDSGQFSALGSTYRARTIWKAFFLQPP